MYILLKSFMTIGQKYDFIQMSPVNFNVFFLLFRNWIYKMKRNAFKSFCFGYFLCFRCFCAIISTKCIVIYWVYFSILKSCLQMREIRNCLSAYPHCAENRGLNFRSKYAVVYECWNDFIAPVTINATDMKISQ